MRFPLESLQVMQKCVPLHCVFHSIRFKVNKRLEYSGTPFFMPFRVGGLFKHRVTEIQSSFLRTVVLFLYCFFCMLRPLVFPPNFHSLMLHPLHVPSLICSILYILSFRTNVRNLSPPLCASSAVEAFLFARDASSPAVIPNAVGGSVSAGLTVPASLLPFAFSLGWTVPEDIFDAQV